MIGIWMFVILSSGALAQEADLDDLFSFENGSPKRHSGIYGELDKGCHECYKCDAQQITNYPAKTNKLRLVDGRGQVTNVCCIPQINLSARVRDDCGKMNSGGIFLNGKKQKKTHVRATAVGEYPWRAWIWKRGEPTPFCGGIIVDAMLAAIVTSASCALKHPVNSLVVTFSRSLESSIDVGSRVVHEEYDSGKPYINDIALLFGDSASRRGAPAWVSHACVSNLPPMQTTFCVVMSKEDYFIDTVVLEQKKCEVDKKHSHMSQMCTAIVKDDYKPEIGAGLFCKDRFQLRNHNKVYYAAGITLQVNDQMIAYTNVSHFEPWIQNVLLSRRGTHHHHHYGYHGH